MCREKNSIREGGNGHQNSSCIGMMTRRFRVRSLSDDELLGSLSASVQKSRRLESVVVEHIAEVDRRRLYRREACSSMFAYCTEVLHLSEAEAYLRITVARATREHPVLLTRLADGRLHLRGIAKLAPLLTDENCEAVLDRAAHQSMRQIEELAAELAPKPDVATTLRKLPRRPTVPAPPPERAQEPAMPSKGAASSTPKHPAPRPVPLAPSRYKVQFTAGAELRDKLHRLTELLRRSNPDVDLADAIDAAVTEKLEKLEAKRAAKTKAPRKDVAQSDTSPSSRYIPAAVKRAVYERDGGRCTFVSADGRRCSERSRVELHHMKPFARGGGHEPDNLSLLCRSHNVYRAERDFGTGTMARYRRPPS